MSESNIGLERVLTTRRAVSEIYIKGKGIEVGAGSRPFPVPDDAVVEYGDIRDTSELTTYFANADVLGGSNTFDAQTMSGIDPKSLDFVISAHVIEHLADPIGSIAATMEVLRAGGIFLLVVPDMRLTFDKNRPETPIGHCMADFSDGGEGTIQQAYEEHLRFVHPVLTGEVLPDNEIAWQSSQAALNRKDFDVHFHAWTMQSFEILLKKCSEFIPLKLESKFAVENENIFVIRKIAR